MNKTINAIFGLLAFLGIIIFLGLFIKTSNNTFGIWVLILFVFFNQCVKNTEK